MAEEAKPWLAAGGTGSQPGCWVLRLSDLLRGDAANGEMVVKRVIFSGILLIVLGIIVAWLYRDTVKT